MQANDPKGARRLERARYPGIFRREGRFVVIWKYRGQQYKTYHRTLAEAREAKGRRDAGDRKPPARELFEDYALEWIESYRGRTKAGLSETSRADYRHSLDTYIVPHFKGLKLD